MVATFDGAWSDAGTPGLARVPPPSPGDRADKMRELGEEFRNRFSILERFLFIFRGRSYPRV